MQKPKWFLAVALLTTATLILAIPLAPTRVLAPQVAMAAVPPVIAIATCNPTFVANVAGGSYAVTANLVPAPGQNCINVTAPGVTINLAGHTLTGTGAGIGIDIFPAAAGTHIIGPGTITNFATGILDSANSALLENLTVKANVGNGVVMTGVDGSVLDTSAITGNGANGVYLLNTRDCIVKYNVQISGNGAAGPGYGVWIQNNAGTVVSLDNIVAANNFGNGGPQLAGVWVGLSPNAVLNCAVAGAPSSGNIIVANQNINANVVVGIGLQCNTATNNVVTDNHNVVGNPAFDLFDGNAACDGNSWVADVFGTKNQACVN
jgi:Right handed beta helix region